MEWTAAERAEVTNTLLGKLMTEAYKNRHVMMCRLIETMRLVLTASAQFLADNEAQILQDGETSDAV